MFRKIKKMLLIVEYLSRPCHHMSGNTMMVYVKIRSN